MSRDTARSFGILRRIAASIYTKALLLCWVIALAPLAVLAFLNYRATRTAAETVAYRGLSDAAKRTAGALDAFLQSNLKLVQVEATRSSFGSVVFSAGQRTNEQMRSRASQGLQALVHSDPVHILSAALLDVNGSNIFDTAVSQVGAIESDRTYFRDALEYDRPFVSGVEFDPADGKPSLYFSCPVRQVRAGRSAGRRGVLRIRYGAYVLQQLIVQHNGLGGPQSFACVLDDNGMLLADGTMPAGTKSSLLFTLVKPRGPVEKSAKPEYVEQPGLLAAYEAARQRAEHFAADLPVRNMLAVSGAIAKVSEANWHVIFVQPQDAFLAPVRAQARNAIVLAALVAGGVAIIAVGMARLLTLPILRLTAFTQRVAAGDLTARIPVKSPDEIGLLAESFNRMTDSLQRRQEELRASHQQLQSIIDNTTAMVYMKDTQGRYLLVNRRHEIVFHTDRRSIVGKTDYDIFPKEQAAQLQANDRKVLETRRTLEWEETLLQDDGLHTYLSVKFPLSDAQGVPYALCGISTDITERKRAERELKRERDFVDAIFQTAGALVVVMDTQGRIIRFNRACEKLTGYTFNEIKGRPFWEFLLTPEEREPVIAVFEKLRAGQFPIQNENFWVTKNGARRLIAWSNTAILDRNGSVAHIIGTGVDVTERAMAEEALRDSQTRLSGLINTAMDGIITVDEEQRIVIFNPAAERMFRCPAAEAVGKSLERFIPLRYREAHREQMANFERSGETRRRMGSLGEITGARADGTEFPIEASISQMEAGGQRFYTVIIRDVTERKRAEEDLRWYTTRLKTLHEIDQAILVARSPDSIAGEALKRLRQLVPCQRSSVVTFDFEARQATVLVAQTDGDTKLGNGARVPIESFLFGNREGLQEGKTHVVADISALRNPPGIISGLLAEGVRCVVNVPLRPGGQLIGVLSLGANTPAAFTAEHLDVAQEVADQLAVAIQQADLYNRVQRHAAELELRVAERTRELREKQSEIEADLQMAREIQQAFMRQQYPAFPQGAPPEKSALRFFQRDRPTGAVGGDFYQVLAISDTQAALFLCDVMGHGVRAALVTAIVRGLVEELKPFADDPGRFLTEINRSLLATLRQAGSPMFVSAFHLAVDVTTGRMQYASAGHPVPMRARAAPDAVEKLPFPAGTIGPVLGLFDDSTYRTLELTVAPGELIVLFTDGLFEVEGPNSDEYGEERLLDAVRRRLGMPPQQMFDEIIEEVLEFSVRKAFRDDACLVGMEVARIG